MLKAEKLKTYKPEKFKPGYMSVKHNGVHGINDCISQVIYSRRPRLFSGMEHITKALQGEEWPLCGELYIPDVDFETSNGKVRDGYSHPEIQFWIFNAIIPNTLFSSRLQYLEELKYIRFFEHPFIKVVKHHPVVKVEEYDKFHQAALDIGAEGTCWISPHHVYKPDARGWDWMKRVPLKALEAEVLAVEPGTKGGKYEHTLGRFVCRLANGITFNCGIFKGKTDAWRDEVWEKRERWIGKFITVEFKDYTKYGKPSQPRFKGERWDITPEEALRCD